MPERTNYATEEDLHGWFFFFRVDITSKDDESSRFATDFKADFVFVVK